MERFERTAVDSPLVNIGDIGRKWREVLGASLESLADTSYTHRTTEHGFHGAGPEHYFNGVLIERAGQGYSDMQIGLWMTISGRRMFVEIRDDGLKPEYTGEKETGQSNIEIKIQNIDPTTDETVGMVGFRWYGSEGEWRFWDYSYCLGKDDIGDILAELDEQFELERQGIQDRLLRPEDKEMLNQIFAGKIQGNLPSYMGETPANNALGGYVAAIDGRSDDCSTEQA